MYNLRQINNVPHFSSFSHKKCISPEIFLSPRVGSIPILNRSSFQRSEKKIITPPSPWSVDMKKVDGIVNTCLQRTQSIIENIKSTKETQILLIKTPLKNDSPIPAASSNNYSQDLAYFSPPKYSTNKIKSYEGGVLDKKPNGKGKCIYKNGYIYEGDFDKGLKHGFGILSKDDIEIFCGEWQLGRFNGDGILVNPYIKEETKNFSNCINDINDIKSSAKTWTKYEGEFKEGKISGFGTIYFANGDKFRGKFLNGSVFGEGTYHSKSEKKWTMGRWENNKLLFTL